MKTKDRFYLAVIAALILTILLMRMCCKESKSLPTVKTNTVVKTITVTDTQTVEKPVPEYVETIVPIIKDVDTASIKEEAVEDYVRQHQYDPQLPDTAKRIINDYTVTRTYKRNYPIQYGSASVTTVVKQNKILSQSIKTTLTVPEKTTTVTVPEKKRNQLYYGGELMGSKITPLNYAGVGLLLKTKKDNIYKVSVMTNRDGQLYVNGGLYWKLKLHR